MYRVKDEYGNIIADYLSPQWVKQQERADCPISAYSYEEADGIVLSDDTMHGFANKDNIDKNYIPKMSNYTPLVTIEEVSSDPFIEQRFLELENNLKNTQSQLAEAQSVIAELKSQSLATMLGITDVYAAVISDSTDVSTGQ